MNDIRSGLHDGTFRARWLRAVMKTTQVTDSVRVLLMTFALHMDANGRVSVPREELAGLLGRSPRKVGERVKLALDSGFLVQTARGQKHQTAVFWGVVDGQCLSRTPGDPADCSDLSGTPGGPAENSQGDGFKDPEPDSQGDGFKDPENREPDLSGTPGGPAENSQEEPRGAPQSLKGVDEGDEVSDSDGSLFDLTRAASQGPKSSRKSRRRPETPIPDDFAVTDEMRAWAKAKGYTVDLDRETFRFINNAHQNERLCRSWLAAWRNWIDIGQEKQDRADARQNRSMGAGSRFAANSGARGRVPTAEELENEEIVI